MSLFPSLATARIPTLRGGYMSLHKRSWIAEVTGGPVPRFEKVEREAPADGVVIEGDDL